MPEEITFVYSPYIHARTKNGSNIKHESLPPQRIQRSSPLGHIESPGDTSDVDVQQENEPEVLDDVFPWSIIERKMSHQ